MPRTAGSTNWRGTKRAAILAAYDAGVTSYAAIASRADSTYGAVKRVLSHAGRTRRESRPARLDAASDVVYSMRLPLGLEIEAEERGVPPQRLALEVLRAVARGEAWGDPESGGANLRIVAEREALPARRRCETLTFRAGGINYTATIGYFDDGRVGEVFLNGGKIASETDVVARDSAVVLSIALQHGVALDAVRSALTRRGDGSPEGPMGILLDLLATAREKSPSLVVVAASAVPAVPVDRGVRYSLELNTFERSLIPADAQQMYDWHGGPQKWIMREEYRAKFSREAEL